MLKYIIERIPFFCLFSVMQRKETFYSTRLGFPAGTDIKQINSRKAYELCVHVYGSPHNKMKTRRRDRPECVLD